MDMIAGRDGLRCRADDLAVFDDAVADLMGGAGDLVAAGDGNGQRVAGGKQIAALRHLRRQDGDGIGRVKRNRLGFVHQATRL